MKIAIVGYEIEGQSAYRHWSQLGHAITICDQKTTIDVPKGADSKLGEDYLKNLGEFDLIVRTAGLNPQFILDANPNIKGLADKITTVVNEFMAESPAPIIGVTGTKGKGTTSSLIAAILGGAGKKVLLAGNIGESPLDSLKNITDKNVVVLELSSFQLTDIHHSPRVGVCLMVVPEHLNWHSDMEDYLHAKQQLFRWQTEADVAIYNADNANSQKVASVSKGQKIPYMKSPGAFVQNDEIIIEENVICKTSELKLLGKHNWQNVCAAVTAAWQFTQDVNAINKAVTSFSGLPHRLELIKEIDEVSYYDDSFGTTPETAIVAIEAFDKPKIVILGGSDKGSEFGELAKAVGSGNVRVVLVIGDTASKITESLESVGYKNIQSGGTTMKEIVEKSRSLAKPGDVVLLSTGCASFGLFKDYKDRGKQFQAAVNSL